VLAAELVEGGALQPVQSAQVVQQVLPAWTAFSPLTPTRSGIASNSTVLSA